MLPWLLLRDFNENLYNTEKEGGNSSLDRYKKAFQDTLIDYDLDDMSRMGELFSW